MSIPQPATSLGRSILVVDDDDTFRTRLVKALTGRGFDARGEGSATKAIEQARQDSPELAVVDLRMPDGFGLDVVKALKEIDATTKILVLTGYGSIATAVEAIRLGATDYLTKPADVDQIVAAFDAREDAAGGAAAGAALKEPSEVPSLARVEWEHIQRVLADCSGNVSQAARLLNIHRRSLQRKLGKYPAKR